MADNVIRKDVVEISFNVGDELSKLIQSFDDLKKKLSGGVGDDAMDDLKDSAEKVVKPLDEVKKSAVGAGKKVAEMETPLNKVKEAANQVSKKVTEIGKKAAVAAFNGLKKVASISLKGLTIGVSAAATAVGGLVTKAVSSYADTEQFVGGVETLFKDSAGIVQKYANNAFKTSGLSANDYMETVTGFSASLLQSLGGDTKKTAEYAEMAITDMSDNANKMGTDMGSIQYAYQGFAKQNYTMLDNLKLGYGGTKSEMERLVKDAAKIDDSIDANSLSYANIIKAIHAVQVNMDITGTTAKEAADTISGSLASMKSAWGNLLPALIQGGDSFDQCVKNLVEAIKTFGKNIMPAMKKALAGVGSLIEELAPMIADALPDLIKTIVPPLFKAGGTIVATLVKALIANAGALANSAKKLALEAVKAIYEGFTGKKMSGDMFDELKAKVEKAFTAIKNIIQGVVSFGQKLLTALAPVLVYIGDLALNVFSWLGENINWLLPLVTALVGAFLAYKAVMIAVKVVTGIITVAQTVMAAVSKLAAKEIATAAAEEAAGTAAAGTSASISTPQILAFAAAILAVGVSLLAACAGLALLAQSAIALANAGGGAIAVMAAMIVVIAGLAVGAALLGSALTAGAIGFIAFGAAVALVGAGFALLGVGAMLAATALSIIASVLPQITTYGLQGTVCIVALGAGLTVFAVGATLAGAAALVLGAGLLVVAAALAVITVAVIAITAMFAAMTLLVVVFRAAVEALPSILSVLIPQMTAFGAALTPFGAALTAAVIPLALFTAALAVLAVSFTLLAVTSAVVMVTFAAITLLITAMTGILTMFCVQLGLMSALFAVASVASLLFTAALVPLTLAMTLAAIPLTVFTALAAVLAVSFTLLAVTSLVFLAAMTGITVTMTLLTVMTTVFNAQLLIMAAAFAIVSLAALQLVAGLTPLIGVFAALIIPMTALVLAVTPLAMMFTLLAAAALVFLASLTALIVVIAAVNILLAVMATLLVALSATMMITTTFIMLMTLGFTMLLPIIAALTPLMLAFTAALLPLAGTFAAVMATALIFTGTMAGLMAIMVILAPMSMIFAAAMALLKPVFSSLEKSVPKFSEAMKPLAGQFTALIIPAGLLVVALAPLAAAFVALAAAAAVTLAAVMGLVTTVMMLSMLFTALVTVTMLLVKLFPMLGAGAESLSKQLIPLGTTLTAISNPLVLVSANFVKLAAALMVAVAATAVMNGSFTQTAMLLVLIIAKFKLLMALLKIVAVEFKQIAETPKTFNEALDVMAIKGNATLITFVGMLKVALSQAQSIVEQIATKISDITDKNITSLVDKVSKLPKKMGDAIKQSGDSLSTAFVTIWKEAVKASVKPVNKLLDGANWILKQFGSDKKVISWTPYAKGTKGHKGGNALVNDGRGAELVQMPNGKTFIPQGRNVFIPNAPKGMKVLPADQTAALMGRKKPTFKYADGTGDIDIWSYIDNAKGLVDEVVKKFVDYKDLSGYVLNVGKSMVSTLSGQMPAWVEKLLEESGGMSIAGYVASKGVEQWRSTVIRALKMEGQYSPANVQRTLMQMQTESGGNPRAINLWDINAKRGIPSKGLMQCIDPTFKAYARKGFDKNIYDPLSNILASIRYAVARYGSLTKAYQGHGYANGGIATKPSIFGESGAEMAIPLSASKRERAIGLWSETGEMLGLSSYTPESAPASYQNNTVTEENYYSPQFNLTISGTNDDRTMSRKVKKWIAEALDETFDSMARKNPKVREV